MAWHMCCTRSLVTNTSRFAGRNVHGVRVEGSVLAITRHWRHAAGDAQYLPSLGRHMHVR